MTKAGQGQNGYKDPAYESYDIGDYFVDIGLDLGEPIIEGRPSPSTKKKKPKSGGKMGLQISSCSEVL